MKRYHKLSVNSINNGNILSSYSINNNINIKTWKNTIIQIFKKNL